ncbi:hypothetical protein I4F81_011130 [Pyropia yezoensis]|uniref:Uncharacterized protein n=1 Tax=Pyropia yezoensis TaxID=2788 RepID=A0ACC3CEX6_PYRYE|nr:hypothetical protein I4F81_011130 [Neopyropia yezoensis]
MTAAAAGLAPPCVPRPPAWPSVRLPQPWPQRRPWGAARRNGVPAVHRSRVARGWGRYATPPPSPPVSENWGGAPAAPRGRGGRRRRPLSVAASCPHSRLAPAPPP